MLTLSFKRNIIDVFGIKATKQVRNQLSDWGGHFFHSFSNLSTLCIDVRTLVAKRSAEFIVFRGRKKTFDKSYWKDKRQNYAREYAN